MSKCKWCSEEVEDGRVYCQGMPCKAEFEKWDRRCQRAKEAGKPVPAKPKPRSSPEAQRRLARRDRKEAVKAVVAKKGFKTVAAFCEHYEINRMTLETALSFGRKPREKGYARKDEDGNEVKSVQQKFIEAGIYEILTGEKPATTRVVEVTFTAEVKLAADDEDLKEEIEALIDRAFSGDDGGDLVDALNVTVRRA